MYNTYSHRFRHRLPQQRVRPRVEQLEDRTVPTTFAQAGFIETTFAAGLNTPTSMAFAPDGRLFVTEKGGTLRVVTANGTVLPTPFVQLNVSSTAQDERGLLGVTFDPNFAANRFLYVYYTTNTAVNRVSRFTADAANPNVAAAGSEMILLDNIPSLTGFHNGGALHFGADGKLYIAVGDSAVCPAPPTPCPTPLAQTTDNLAGKILRINADGTIPNDNPFFNTAAGDNRAIWALGLRNPFTFAVNPANGQIFVNDVGEDTTEEINELQKSGNYGWPNFEGSDNGNPNFIDPIFTYPHDGQSSAVTGGIFSAANAFPTGFQGYFFSDYQRGFISILDPVTHQARAFAIDAASPVDLDQAPDGTLLYLSIGSGNVFRIQTGTLPPAAGQQTPPKAVDVTLASVRRRTKTRLLVRVQFSDGRLVEITSPYQRSLYRAIRAVLTDLDGVAGPDGILFTARRLLNNKKVMRVIRL